MIANLKSIVQSGVETIENTPFVKDVKSGGLLNGITSGTERETLRSYVVGLEEEHKNGANIEYLLKKYDLFSKDYHHKDIVANMRNRLIKSTIGNLDVATHGTNQHTWTGLDHVEIVYVINYGDKYYVTNSSENLTELDVTTREETNVFLPEYVKNNFTSFQIVGHEKSENVRTTVLNKVYELMEIHGVANVRGSRYVNELFRLDEANELIKTVMYLKEKSVLFAAEENLLDTTVIETFVLWRNGFTIDEIATMKSLLPSTIQTHLDKAMQRGITIVDSQTVKM